MKLDARLLVKLSLASQQQQEMLVGLKIDLCESESIVKVMIIEKSKTHNTELEQSGEWGGGVTCIQPPLLPSCSRSQQWGEAPSSPVFLGH